MSLVATFSLSAEGKVYCLLDQRESKVQVFIRCGAGSGIVYAMGFLTGSSFTLHRSWTRSEATNKCLKGSTRPPAIPIVQRSDIPSNPIFPAYAIVTISSVPGLLNRNP